MTTSDRPEDTIVTRPEHHPAPAHVVKTPAVNNGLAVTAFVFAFFVPIVAIILGHVSHHESRVAGRENSGLATAALVLGYIFTAIGAVIFIALLAAIAHSQDPTQQFINCLNNSVANGTDPSVCNSLGS